MRKILLTLSFIFLFATQGWCATKTWQNGGVDNNWSTAGNWVEGSKPTAGDDVVISAAYNCVVNEATANLKSLDMTGYANTLSGTSAINVIGAASSTVSVKIAGTITWTGTLNLNPTAADTNIELTANSKTLQAITINGNAAGDVYFLDNTTVTANVTLSQGTLHTDGAADNSGLTHSWQRFVGTSTSTKTLNLGNSTITCSNANNYAWGLTATSTTFTCGTSTIVLTGNGAKFTGGAQTYSTVTFQTGTGTKWIESSNTFGTLNVTGTAAKTGIISLYGDNTITSTLNVDGNSAVNRVLVASDTLGTARTLTLTGCTVSGCTNVDFKDITFVGSPDFSAITGGSGDCGGNSGATFTTADDWYWNGSGTRNFSNYVYWYTATNGGGSQMAATLCPLPQDNCFFDANSIDGATTVDQDMPRICHNLDFTGCGAMNFHMNNVGQQIYGSLTFVANITTLHSILYTIYFEARGSHTYTSAGQRQVPHLIQAPGGTIQLLDDLDIGNSLFNVLNGTFDANDNDFTGYIFISNNTNTRTILMGSGTFTINSITAGVPWNLTDITNLSNPTTMAETSTIIFGSAVNDSLEFAGGGATYNNLTIVATGTGHFISGSNTFNTFTINSPKTVKFTASTTQTVADFVATGTAGNEIDIGSVTPGSSWQITKTGGGTCVNDYLNVTDSHGHPDSTFYYGANGSGDAYSDANGWAAAISGMVRPLHKWYNTLRM